MNMFKIYDLKRFCNLKFILSAAIIFLFSGMEVAYGSEVTASYGEFYTLHPLIVHFPIVLLIVALFAQILGFFIYKEALSWGTLTILIIGFVTAYISGSIFHPHVKDLEEGAKSILTEHEFYADLTVWLSGVAMILKILNKFILNKRFWLEIIIVLTIGMSAISVGIAGHYGAWLTHIEGVGPQGNYLEMEEHHDHSH